MGEKEQQPRGVIGCIEIAMTGGVERIAHDCTRFGKVRALLLLMMAMTDKDKKVSKRCFGFGQR